MNRSPIQLGWLASSQVDVLLHCIDEVDATSSMLFQQVISVVFIYVAVDMRYLQKDIKSMKEFDTITTSQQRILPL